MILVLPVIARITLVSEVMINLQTSAFGSYQPYRRSRAELNSDTGDANAVFAVARGDCCRVCAHFNIGPSKIFIDNVAIISVTATATQATGTV